MRRKAGVLLPIEVAILRAGLELRRGGEDEFHGYGVAKAMQADGGARRLTAHGTLYRALERMEKAGLLESEMEPPDRAELAGRPRRRLYRVTAAGELAVEAAAQAGREAPAPGLTPRVSPS